MPRLDLGHLNRPEKVASRCPGCDSWDECQCEVSESCCLDEVPCPLAGGIPCGAEECLKAGDCMEVQL